MGQVYWQGELQSIHASSVGDVVGWLERLCQKGYLVRPGWIIAATDFEQAISQLEPLTTITQEDSLDPSHVPDRWTKDHQYLQSIAHSLQTAIQTVQLSEATRTAMASALARMPPQQWQLKPSLLKRDSLLHLSDVSGWWDTFIVDGNLEALTEAIRQLWHNTFSAQNLFYWFSHHCQIDHIKFAILVQSVGRITCSGFLRINPHSCQVEAVWGMSQAILWGEAVPARYEVTWDGKVLAQGSGHQILAYSSEAAITQFDPQAELIAADYPGNPILYRLSERVRGSPLSTELCTTLQALGEQLWQDFRTPAVIEWSYGSEADEPAQVWFASFEVLHPAIQGAVKDATPVASLPQSATVQRLSGLAASPGKVSGSAFVLTQDAPMVTAPPGILIVPTLGPAGLSLLRQVQGVITEQGGLTSHGAILARELGIPAVVGVAGATQRLQSGDWVTLDGDRGEIQYLHNPNLPSSNHPTQPRPTDPASEQQLDSQVLVPSPTRRSTVTKLYVNLSQLESLATLKHKHLDGVGLLRAEFMMLDIVEQQHPFVWIEQGRGLELSDRLAHQIHQFTQAFAPRPVFYRFLDLHGQVFQQLTGHLDTSRNSFLGLRGALSYQHFPELFRVELAALRQVQAAGSTNLHVLVPFVRSVAEFEFCRSHIQQAGLLNTGDLEIWMMVEVPSVLFQLPDYQQAGVQGISIGSNDLTQLLLGVDRDHPLGEALDARHPAVQRAIAGLIQQAREMELPCSICGDAPVLYPELVDKLVSWGISAISVNASALETTYQAIVQAEALKSVSQ